MPLQAKILIAEDEAPLRNLVRMSLEATGHHVATVNDGEEALKAFAAEAFDLVIVDIMMPHVDGFGVCQQIRMQSDVPIIMLTALGGADDMIKGFELGADDYIAKPFAFKEVQARIRALLRRYRWIKERQEPPVLHNSLLTPDGQPQPISSEATA